MNHEAIIEQAREGHKKLFLLEDAFRIKDFVTHHREIVRMEEVLDNIIILAIAADKKSPADTTPDQD